MEKVAPSERFRQELDEVLAGVGGEQDPVEVVGRLGARLILQQALEDEVTEFLGRRRYQRANQRPRRGWWSTPGPRQRSCELQCLSKVSSTRASATTRSNRASSTASRTGCRSGVCRTSAATLTTRPA